MGYNRKWVKNYVVGGGGGHSSLVFNSRNTSPNRMSYSKTALFVAFFEVLLIFWQDLPAIFDGIFLLFLTFFSANFNVFSIIFDVFFGFF